MRYNPPADLIRRQIGYAASYRLRVARCECRNSHRAARPCFAFLPSWRNMNSLIADTVAGFCQNVRQHLTRADALDRQREDNPAERPSAANVLPLLNELDSLLAQSEVFRTFRGAGDGFDNAAERVRVAIRKFSQSLRGLLDSTPNLETFWQKSVSRQWDALSDALNALERAAADATTDAAGVEWVPTSSFAKCFQGPNASTKAQRFAKSRFAESGQCELRGRKWFVVGDVMQRAIDADLTRRKLPPDGKIYGK